MKKSELKNIIKECVKEVIFEEGVLSGIITEVARGLGTSSSAPAPQLPTDTSRKLQETKKQVLTAVGNQGYEELKQKFSNPELFEGTKPITDNKGHGALSGVSPHDSGVDIASLPGFSQWGNVLKNIK